MKAKELRNQAVQELEAMLADFRREYYDLIDRAKQSAKFQEGHRILRARRDIARTLTVLREKQNTKGE